MKIGIIGAGVGGLTLSLSLLKVGFTDIHLYESSEKISELGVGINILPHAMKEIENLGLIEKFMTAGVETSELLFYTKNGQRVWEENRGKKAGYLWPQISIHRGDLIRILYEEVLQRLGENRLHTGHRLVNLDIGSDGVEAVFEGGTESFDCLIACDGIHSTVRKKLYPNEGAPKWSGVTMWRGVTLTYPKFTNSSMVVAGGTNHRLVVYPIKKNEANEEKVLINWIAKLKTDASQRMPKEDWSHDVKPDDLLGLFNDFDFLDISTLINNASAIYKYPVIDRDPLPNWDFGNVTLLGDAAHPMYPSGSNGASQAIIDAQVLSKLLAKKQTIKEAINSYDNERRSATNTLMHANRHAAPERCIDIVENRAPNGFTDIYKVISKKELDNISLDYKKIAGFERGSLNEKKFLSM